MSAVVLSCLSSSCPACCTPLDWLYAAMFVSLQEWPAYLGRREHVAAALSCEHQSQAIYSVITSLSWGVMMMALQEHGRMSSLQRLLLSSALPTCVMGVLLAASSCR